MVNKQKTRNLYRTLRGALLSKDTDTVFRTLRSIVEIDPQDAYAREQLEEIGETLCSTHASELEAALSRQDIASLTRLVADFRSWAKEEWLVAHVPAYSRAVSMACRREQASVGTPPPATGESKEASARPAVPASAKSGANPQTKNMYRELRGAVAARNHELIFDILSRIIEQDPQDAGAREQRAETGRWLCDANSGEVAAVLASQDKTAIRKTVERFRAWVDESYLKANVPSYTQAAQVADIMRNAELKRELEALFARLSGMEDVQRRHVLEEEISRFTINNGVELSDEQQGVLSEVRDAWAARKLSEERSQMLEEAEETLAGIRENYRSAENPDEALTIYAADLLKLRQELSEKEPFPELDAFYARVVKYQDNARARQAARRRQKWLRRTVAAVIAWVFLGAACGVGYLYSTVDAQTYNIYEGLKGKDYGYLQQVVSSDTWSLVTGYRKVSSEYELAYQRADEWLKKRKKKIAKFGEELKTVEQESDNLDMMKMMSALDSWSEAMGLASELQQVYGYNPTIDEAAVLEGYKVALMQRRGAIMASFLDKPGNMTFDDMVARNKVFAVMSLHLEFTPEETDKYHCTLNEYAEGKLLHAERYPWQISVAELDESLRTFDTYAAELELNAGIRERLERLKAQAHNYSQREKRLANCSTMQGYLDTLHSFNEYMKLSTLSAYKDEWLKVLPSKLPSMACTLAVDARPRVKSSLNKTKPEEYSLTLKAVKDIFSGGSKDVYMGNYNRSIRHIIDKLLPPGERSSSIWPAQAEQYYANKIYVTDARKNKPRINGEEYIYPLNARGELEQKVAVLHALPHKRLKLDSMRDALGFKREPMVQLQVSPVQLMMNIARNKDDGFPALACAYLFDQCVEMLSYYEMSPASGLAFSPLLRADLEAFRAMKSKHPLRPGCWLEAHSTKSEQEWRRFFAGIDDHNYKAEVCAAVDALLKAKLTYAGFIREDGLEMCVKSGVSDSKLYFVDFRGDSPVCVPYRPGERCLPYTPLFVLNY